MIRKLVAALWVLMLLTAASEVYGRGGQSADDCPPTSKDPDCAGSK